MDEVLLTLGLRRHWLEGSLSVDTGAVSRFIAAMAGHVGGMVRRAADLLLTCFDMVDEWCFRSILCGSAGPMDL